MTERHDVEVFPAWQPYPPRPRGEDRRLVTGAGRYVGNLSASQGRELHAGFVRSVDARGKVLRIDLDDVANHRSVVAVYTGADLGLADIKSGIDNVAIPRPILANEQVQHVGEAVALVVASDPVSLIDAVELAAVEIEAEQAVVEPMAALAAAPLHTGATSNIVDTTQIGDPAHGWDRAAIDTIVELTVHNQRLAPVTLEPLAVLAEPGMGAGSITVHLGHQAPHLLKRQLTQWFGATIEVSVPDVGGGYGLKARLYPEYVAIVEACRRLGQAVRWTQTRSEQFLTGCHGRDMTHHIRVGGSRDGRIHRIDLDFVFAVGAYPHLGAMVAGFTRLVSQQLYDIPELSVSSTTVVTNTAPIAPYRGAGRPEAAYAIERAVDAFARKLGLDTLQVRARNLLRPESWPHVTSTGAKYDSGDYSAVLDRAAEIVGVPELRTEQTNRLKQWHLDRNQPLLGLGFSAWVERAGGAPDTGEYAKVEASVDGKLVVSTGSTDNGQGHETVWAQVAGAAFGLTASDIDERVRVQAGDTSVIPRGSGSSASRSAQIGASAAYRCSHRLMRRLAVIAADMLEAAVKDVMAAKGGFEVQGVPERSLEIGVVVEEAIRRDRSGSQTRAPQDGVWEEEWYVPGSQTFPYGVHAAVIEVDTETGFVAVVRYIAVDDCGVVLHPDMVDGQTVGSVAQGIGQALFEQVVYNEAGQLLTGTLLDYTVPGASDLPARITTDRVVSPAPGNTLGAKGAGEGGCIGAPPAVVNAVLDALASLGVDHLDMPLYPEKIWSAVSQQDACRVD